MPTSFANGNSAVVSETLPREIQSDRRPTEELLASTTLLNYFHQPRLQLLNWWHVIGKDTHLPWLGSDVDLDSAQRTSQSPDLIARKQRNVVLWYVHIDWLIYWLYPIIGQFIERFRQPLVWSERPGTGTDDELTKRTWWGRASVSFILSDTASA